MNTDTEFNIRQSQAQDAATIEQLRRERQQQQTFTFSNLNNININVHFGYMGIYVDGTISEVPDDPR